LKLKHLSWRVNDAGRMLWKRALSYRKRQWEFEDYPVVVRRQRFDDVSDHAEHESRYSARVLGWLIDETAPASAEALAKLRERFAQRKQLRIDKGEPIPRPGVRVPITFASQERVNADKELADDFVHRVLHFEWAFMSDESTLWDFTAENSIKEFQDRIFLIYGVSVYDIENGNVSSILERIRTRS
jgi:hypothetical protein